MELAIISLVLIFVIREYSHHKHDTRRDKLISELTDKIKANDFVEYVGQTKPIKVFSPVSKDDEDLYLQEIEDSKV